MAKDTYEVLVPALTVHKSVGELRDANGNVVGHQLGQGKTVVSGTVLSESDISPQWVEALGDKNHPLHDSLSRKLGKSGDDPKDPLDVRLALPFTGYDDAEEDQVLAAMASLPSSTIQAIKEYESANENRERIVNFNIGFGQSPRDRIDGLIGGGLEEDRDDEAKPTANFKTRVVEEDNVEFGEGYTGTGDPQVPHGSAAAAEDDESVDAEPGNARGRRRRQRKPNPAVAEKGKENTGDAGTE